MTTMSPEHPVTEESKSLAEKRREALAKSGEKPAFPRVAAGVFLLATLAAVFFIIQIIWGAKPSEFWHLLTLSVVFTLLAGLSGYYSWFAKKASSSSDHQLKHTLQRPMVLIIAVQVCLLVLSLMVTGVGMFCALVALALCSIIAFASFEKEQVDNTTLVRIFGAFVIILSDLFPLFQKIVLPDVLIYLSAILGILVMILLVLLNLGMVITSIRTKLVAASLLIALIPLALLSFTQALVTRNSLNRQNFDGLQQAAQQTSTKLDEFIFSTTNKVQQDATLPVFSNFVTALNEDLDSTEVRKTLNTTIAVLKNDPQAAYLFSIGILNMKAENVFDTRSSNVGRFEANAEYFSVPANDKKGYSSSVMFDSGGNSYIVFSAPIINNSLQTVGVYRVMYSAMILQRLMESNRGLYGYRSYPMLIDENFVRLGDGSDPGIVYQPIVTLPINIRNDLIVRNRLPLNYTEYSTVQIPEMEQAIKAYPVDQFFSYKRNYGDVPNAGAVVKMNRAPWHVVYVQRQDFLIQLFDQQTQVSLLVATYIALMMSYAAVWFARQFSKPIVNLTETAEEVAAGNLNAVAGVESSDEIGNLAGAFNQMTRQLATLVNELEARVNARTQQLSEQNLSLQYRSQQLQTVSEVARSVTSVQELQNLLERVTVLISDRFDFYHVGIFLVDERNEYAVLRAANSEGGRRMLSRQHHLKVGEVGIVGYVCGKGEARITTDVGKDAVFFNNPDLPLTRSEMALPLRVGEKIIGALDVQSTKGNAFSEEDIELFGILADQVTIAIINNRLFEETNRALVEVQGLHRQYLRQEWEREMEDQEHSAFVYTPQGVVARDILPTPELEQVLNSGAPYLKSAAAGAKSEAAMVIPIILRGEPIGVIHLKEANVQERDWSPDEVSTVQSVADQIALALENVRLLEQTTRRAERERVVLEITSKIRATNDFQSMITVAVEELQRVLKSSTTQVIFQNPGQSKPTHSSGGNGRHPDSSDQV